MENDYYKVLLVLHLLAVIAGIGTVVLNGIYGAKADAAGPNGGNAIVRANFEVSKVAEKIIYLIPIFGILMVIQSNRWDFGQTWVWLSLVLYVIALGVAHGVLVPQTKRMIELTQGPPTPEVETVGNKLKVAGTALDLIVVALVVLMVWKPGV